MSRATRPSHLPSTINVGHGRETCANPPVKDCDGCPDYPCDMLLHGEVDPSESGEYHFQRPPSEPPSVAPLRPGEPVEVDLLGAIFGRKKPQP